MDTKKFAELGLNEQILAGVEDLGFTTPTPVQKQAIPEVLAGRDVIASAQTGTGKTAAFVLPILQLIQGRTVTEAVPVREAEREIPAPEETLSERLARREAAGMPPEPAYPTCAPGASESIAEAAPASESGREIPAPEETLRERLARREAAGMPPEPAYPTCAPGASEWLEEDEGGLAVLADEIPTPHLSVPALTGEGGQETEGGARRRRARRRHHRHASEATSPATPQEHVAPKPADAEATGERKPKRRRSRGRRKKAAGTESSEAAASPTQKDATTDAKPARKRGRSRRRGAKSGAAQADLLGRKCAYGPFALVVTPTRELAQQIEHVAEVVCRHTEQRAVTVVGGARLDRQVKELEKGCDLLVATPGRLIDLMDHDHVSLDSVEILVLDEADRMLDMGFWPSVRKILAALPKERQNLLFSATIPPSIKGFVDSTLKDPAIIEIARQGETATTVEEHLMCVTQGQKTQLLLALIKSQEQDEETARVLVFCRTKQRADDVARSLTQAQVACEVMHSDRPQHARERALEKFRDGRSQVLVATDVMSRGIDVEGIDAVVNFDVPLDPEDYVHRIGRTGRAGRAGLAYTFCAPDEVGSLREIEYFCGKLIPLYDLEGFAYDTGRIVPASTRSTIKPKRTMFSGARSRSRSISGGRYGRHY